MTRYQEICELYRHTQNTRNHVRHFFADLLPSFALMLEAPKGAIVSIQPAVDDRPERTHDLSSPFIGMAPQSKSFRVLLEMALYRTPDSPEADHRFRFPISVRPLADDKLQAWVGDSAPMEINSGDYSDFQRRIFDHVKESVESILLFSSDV